MSFWSRLFARRQKSPEQIESPRRVFSSYSRLQANEDSAMQVSAFYRGIIYISTQIAKLPWQVKDSKNNIQDGNVATLLDLIPNSEMSAFQFRLTMVQNAIVYGNAYAEIVRNALGQPVAIWPIRPRDVEPYRMSDGKLIYRVIGGSSVEPNSDVYLPTENVFHIKNFHTKDGIVGQGVVAYAQDILGISLGADQTAGTLFANGGLPSGTLEVPGTLSPEAAKRLGRQTTADAKLAALRSSSKA
jgi:HK97 family phage portal protein